MASSTELINEWNYLETQIQVKLEEVETLRQQQKEVKAKLPRLYFVEGFGKSKGLAERVHFVGTSYEECRQWVFQNPKLSLVTNGQIFLRDTPSWGASVAGEIRSVTPVDGRWWEILAWPDLGKGESKTIIQE